MTLLALALLSALPSVQVVDRAGKPVPEAKVVCVDPGPGAEPCRKVRCEAEGWISGEAAVAKGKGRCTLDRALTVVGEIPGPPRGSVEVRLLSARSTDAVLKTAPAPVVEPGAPLRFAFPTTRAGSFRLEVARGVDGWTCRTELGPVAGRLSVPVGWVEPAVVNGRTIDLEDRPVEGLAVRVEAVGRAAERGSSTVRGAWSCRQDLGFQPKTDAEGRFRLPFDDRDELLVVAGDLKAPEGLAWSYLDEVPASPLVLRVKKPVRLVARVLDRDDNPQACKARLSPSTRRESTVLRAFGVKEESPCDSSGRLETAPFPPIDWNLKVRPAAGMMVLRSGPAPESASVHDLGVIRSEPGESISVIVSDTGARPIPGAQLKATGSAGVVLTVEGTTDEEGGVVLSGLPLHATVRLDVRADGYVRDVLSTTISDEPLRVTLARACTLSGKVIDDEGEPVAGARVEILGPEGVTRADSPTGADGRFETKEAPPGKLRVAAQADGYAEARGIELEIAGGERRDGLELVIPKLDGISGRVVDAEKRPVAGARVRLVAVWALEDSPNEPARAETRSAADGSFRLPGSELDEVVLVATAEGHGPVVDRAPSSLGAEGLTLVLPPEAKLRVRFSTKPSTPKYVTVVDGAGVAQARWLAGEHADFDGLAPGAGRAGTGVRAAKATTLVAGVLGEVVLESGGTVSGIVHRDGTPISRGSVWALRLKEKGFDRAGWAEPDGNGRYRVEGLEAGRYRMLALAAEGRVERDVEVTDGASVDLDLPIASVLALVRVREAKTGRPVPHAHTSIGPTGRPCGQTEGMWSWGDPWDTGVDYTGSEGGCDFRPTGADGTAVLRPPSPGDYTVAVQPKGLDSVERHVTLEPGENVIEVEVARGKKPSLEVVLDTDPPGMGGTLSCGMPGGNFGLGGVAGVAECPNVEAGSGLLVFVIRGYGFGWKLVELPEGAEVEATVTTRRGGRLIVPAPAGGERPALDDGSGAPWERILGAVSDLVRFESGTEFGPAWVIDGVPPGRYAVSVGGVARGVVEVTAGGVVVAR